MGGTALPAAFRSVLVDEPALQVGVPLASTGEQRPSLRGEQEWTVVLIPTVAFALRVALGQLAGLELGFEVLAHFVPLQTAKDPLPVAL